MVLPPSYLETWKLGNLEAWNLINSVTKELGNSETLKKEEEKNMHFCLIWYQCYQKKKKKTIKEENCKFLPVLVLVLVSALVDRFSVSCMQDFLRGVPRGGPSKGFLQRNYFLLKQLYIFQPSFLTYLMIFFLKKNTCEKI